MPSIYDEIMIRKDLFPGYCKPSPLWFWDEVYWDTFEGQRDLWGAMLYGSLSVSENQRGGLAELLGLEK